MKTFTQSPLPRRSSTRAFVVAFATIAIAGCAPTPSIQTEDGGIEAAAIQRDGQRLLGSAAPATDGHDIQLDKGTAVARTKRTEGGQP